MSSNRDREAWTVDQLTKSEFFHQKLHEWGMLEVAARIEGVRGEDLSWSLEKLAIAEKSWNKVIHRGIRPVIVFAHPEVLGSIPRAVGYYRMLAMVSQKSMSHVKLSSTRYENGRNLPDGETTLAIARHLNRIISHLVEMDEEINAREFDLWRGMAAGSQAQGSWQNAKGERAERIVKGILQRRLREEGFVVREIQRPGLRMETRDGRVFVFADEPDVAVYKGQRIEAAIEIKGGIDPAGVLERVGAGIKSLHRAKEVNPQSITIFIIQGISMTTQAERDIEANKDAINYWYTIEDILENELKRNEFFKLLGI